MATITKDLGAVTAYAYAVAGGYTGTEEEFEELLGNIAIDLGEIENLSVVAETLPAGSSATASYADGVLTLGIPKGDTGDVTPVQMNSAIDSAVAVETAARQAQDNVLSARMDAFTQLPSGSTSGDAELADIRVGANGKTYSTAGDAVRGQYSDLKANINLIEDGTGLVYEDVIIANGTPANPGNANAVRSSALIPVAWGDELEIVTDRPNTAGYHYAYANYWYNSSQTRVGGADYPNGVKRLTNLYAAYVYFNFAIVEKSDTDATYNPLRTTSFTGYHIWIKKKSGTSVDDLKIAEDNSIPILRNGSVGNTGNANAVSFFLTYPVPSSRSMQLEYLGSLGSSEHIQWTIYLYTSAAAGEKVDTAISNSHVVASTAVETDIGVKEYNLTSYLSSRPTAAFIGVSVVILNGSTPVPLRTENVGDVIKVRNLYELLAQTLKDGLQTILPREPFAYIVDSGRFIFKDYPRFLGSGKCAWRATGGIMLNTVKDLIAISIDDLITALGADDTVTDDNNVKWVNIRPGYGLVYDISNNTWKTVQINGTRVLASTEYPILLFWSGQAVGGMLFTKFIQDAYSVPSTLFNSANIFYNIDVEAKGKEFTNLISGNTDTESFLFFTDPHTYGHNYSVANAEKLQTVIQKFYNSTPTSFVICGGDWLTDSDTRSDAKYKLGLIESSMEAMVDPYYPMFGNHDSNYQGVNDQGDANTGILDNGVIANIFFRRWGKAYYSFEGDNTKFYVFDSQLDWNMSMSDYLWTQIDWFATALQTEEHAHIAVAIHIWTSAGAEAPIATNIKSVVTAYNNRTSVTLNNKTYNYSNASGRIEFVIAGHEHADGNAVINNSVPVVKTINAWKNNVVCFDLVYADYTARTIDFIRVGTGNNRQFSLDTGELITQ